MAMEFAKTAIKVEDPDERVAECPRKGVVDLAAFTDHAEGAACQEAGRA